MRALLILLVVALVVTGGAATWVASTAGSTKHAFDIDDATAGRGLGHVTYSSGWTSGSEARFHDGTEHYSSTAGSVAVVRFSGTQIALYGGVGIGAGIAGVSVDGGPAYEVDFYAKGTAGERQLWVSAPLPRGAHRLRVEVSGTHRDGATGSFVALDRFRVSNARTEVSSARTKGAAAFHYSSGWRMSSAGATLAARSGIVRLTFSGGAVIVYGSVRTGTVVRASLDGSAATRRSPGAADSHGRAVLFASGSLPAGSHSLRLLVDGSSAQPARVVGADVVRHVVLLHEPTSTTGTTAGWRMYEGNPVVGKNWGTAFDLSALYEDGVYKMWFSWRPEGSVAYVQSVDGVSWTAPRSVLDPRPNTWESIVNRPSVIRRPDGGYAMWYTGQNGDASAIGYARSDDGVRWTRAAAHPVLAPEEHWEQPSVMNPSVLWDAKARRYRMWFSGGATYEPNAIGYATSTDGVRWTRVQADPVLERNPNSAWESDRVAGVQVIPDGAGYLAFYIGYADIHTASIGIARSADGVHWDQRSSRPIVSAVAGTWDCDAVYKPFALYVPVRHEWHLWFNGRCGAPEQIGTAVHPGRSLG